MAETKTMDNPKFIDPFAPIDYTAYMVEKDQRTKRVKERMPLMRECLDPEVASRLEAQKPVHDYEVSCIINEMVKGKMASQAFIEKVTAQSAADAWSKFCDRIQRWPGPKYCDRKIERIKK